MAQSKLQNEKECYLCHSKVNLEDHHIFNGPKRKLSETDGLKVWLCHYHHTGSNDSAHLNHEVALFLKQKGQEEYEKTHTRVQFVERYGKSYL